jgi:hypothetical protein
VSSGFGFRSLFIVRIVAGTSRCNYNGCMSVSLTIRALPEATRDTLKERAEANHKSLNSYIVDILDREADLPTMDEWVTMVQSRSRLIGSSDSAIEVLRELREAS